MYISFYLWSRGGIAEIWDGDGDIVWSSFNSKQRQSQEDGHEETRNYEGPFNPGSRVVLFNRGFLSAAWYEFGKDNWRSSVGEYIKRSQEGVGELIQIFENRKALDSVALMVVCAPTQAEINNILTISNLLLSQARDSSVVLGLNGLKRLAEIAMYTRETSNIFLSALIGQLDRRDEGRRALEKYKRPIQKVLGKSGAVVRHKTEDAKEMASNVVLYDAKKLQLVKNNLETGDWRQAIEALIELDVPDYYLGGKDDGAAQLAAWAMYLGIVDSISKGYIDEAIRIADIWPTRLEEFLGCPINELRHKYLSGNEIRRLLSKLKYDQDDPENLLGRLDSEEIYFYDSHVPVKVIFPKKG